MLTAVDDNGNSFSVGSAYRCTSQKKFQLHQTPLQQACQVVFFHLEILSMWSEYIITASAFFSDTIPSKCSTGGTPFSTHLQKMESSSTVVMSVLYIH